MPAVTTIGGSAFANCTSLKTVDLSGMDALTTIKAGAFFRCTALESVTLGSKLTGIDKNAFNGCEVLQTLTMDASELQTIGSSAFSGCAVLPSFPFSDAVKLTMIDVSAFQNCTSLKAVEMPQANALVCINTSAFFGCTALEKVTLHGEQLETIGGSAFKNCKTLRVIDLSTAPNLVEIATEAFFECSSLTDVDLSHLPRLTTIGERAFSRCMSLVSVALTESTELTKLGNWAFSTCQSLVTMDLSTLTKIDALPTGLASQCIALEHVYLPEENEITAIGANAFSNCHFVTFPFDRLGKVTTVGDGAFIDCKHLREVAFPEGSALTTIEANAFSKMSELTSFRFDRIPKLRTVGAGCFQSASSLEEADMTELVNLETIPQRMFASCGHLKRVLLPRDGGAITSIGYQAFISCSLLEELDTASLKHLKTLGGSAFSSTRIRSLDFSNTPLESIGENAFSTMYSLTSLSFKNCTELKSFGENPFTTGSTFIIPLTEIDLSGCASLNAIPEDFAAKLNLLHRVDLTGCTSLKEIGNRAFRGRTLLTELIGLETCKALETIGEEAFSGCSAMSTLHLGESIKTIESRAFADTSCLNTIVYDNMSGDAAVALDAFAGAGKQGGIAVRVTQNTRRVADNLFAADANLREVLFDGENEPLVIGLNAFASAGTPLSDMSDGTSEYYVDANGAVYSKDRTVLYYIPPHITTYAVPSTVTRVASNSCAKASALTSLTFAAPERVTELSDGAFAECATLSAINGCTTVADVRTRVFGGVREGARVYYHTGLQDDDETGTPVRRITETVAGDGEENARTLTLSFGENSGNYERLLPEGDDRIPDIDPQTAANNPNVRYYQTNEVGKLFISASTSRAVKNSTTIRVYFDCTTENMSFEYAPGAITITDSNGEQFSGRFHRITGTRVWCLELEIAVGKTLALETALYYPNFSGVSQSVRIWGEIFESTADAPTPRTTAAKYLEGNWFSAHRKWDVQKTMSNVSMKMVTEDDRQVKRLNIITSRIQPTATSTTSLIGVDPVVATYYEDTLSLPEGITWEREIVKAVQAGHVGWRMADSKTTYIFVTLPDGTRVDVLGLNRPIRQAAMRYDEATDAVTICWTCGNANFYTDSPTGQWMDTTWIGATFYSERLFAVADSYDLTAAGNKITNTVVQKATYLFAEAQQSTATVQAGVNAPIKPVIGITKTAYYHASNRFKQTYVYGGDKVDFTLTVTNSGLAAPDQNRVIDNLPSEFCIRPADMDRMFAEDTRHELTIIVEKAYLQPQDRTVTTTDGKTMELDPITRGDMLSDTDSCRVVIGWTDDSHPTPVVRVYNGETVANTYFAGDGREYPDLSTLLLRIGLLNRHDTTYNCTWESVNYPSAGLTVKHVVYSTVKTSFEQLQRDSLVDIFEGQKTEELRDSNVAYDKWSYKGGAPETKNDWVGQFLWMLETRATKTATQNGIPIDEGVTAGEVIRFRVGANRIGNVPDYGAMPMNSSMTGAAVLLAAVEGNEQALLRREDGTTVSLPQAGLETFTDSDGKAYYILSETGTYTNIFVGKNAAGKPVQADRVEVSRTTAGNTRTRAYWYVADVSESNAYTIDYTALPDVKYGAVGSDGSSYLSDVFYLNEREGDRLFVPTGSGVRQLYSDKFVVLANPARYNEELTKDSVITQGQDVTYKLSVVNRCTTTAYSPAIQYDKLPNTYGRFAWTTDNVRIVSSRSETPAWRISPVSPGGEIETGVYYIYWNQMEDGDPDENGRYVDRSKPTTVTLSREETLDFYVTLTFPRDEEGDTAWSRYSDAVFANGNALKNTFVVNSMENVTTHQLPVVGRPLLQKGVYGIYKRYDLNASSFLPNKREYAIDDGHNQYVTYYVALYNAGETRMYLNPVVDMLPKGVEFRNLCSVTGASGTLDHNVNAPSIDGNLWTAADQLTRFYPVSTSCDTRIFTYAYKDGATDGHLSNELLVNVTPKDMALPVEYVSAHINSVYNTKNGRNDLTFTITQDYDDSGKYPTGSICWDAEREMCYLEPNQALVFGYLCDIGNDAKTEDVSRNTVAMEYYDHNQAGCQLPDKSIQVEAGNHAAFGGRYENDGDRRLLTGEEAQGQGLAPSPTADSRWLFSQVDIRPAETVVPGVQKLTVSHTKSTGETEPLIEQGFCEPKDTQAWSMELHNSGMHDLDTYTFVDTLQYPYMLYGDVTMQMRDALNGQLCSKGGYAREQSGGDPLVVFASVRNNILLKGVRFETADGQTLSESYLKNRRSDVRVKFETQIGTVTGEDVTWLTTRSYSLELGKETEVEVDRLLLKRVGALEQQKSTLQTVKIYVTFDFDEDLNCVMKLRFDRTASDGFGAVPAYGGTATLTTQSVGLSGAIAYGTIVNRATLQPDNAFTFDKIDRGMPLRDKDGELTGVFDEASFAVKGSFSTLSWKTVTQDGAADNTASSRASKGAANYITLPVPTAQSHATFTYRLNVMNTCTDNKAIDSLTVFDNLPQYEDRHPFTEEARNSDFGVELTGLQAAIKVYDVDENGHETALSPAAGGTTLGYTLEFSTAQTVDSGTEWLTADAVTQRGLAVSAIRSFRVTVEGGGGIAGSHTVAIDVNARVVEDDHCRPGTFAWNNFGYSYTLKIPGLSDVKLSAASRIVGVQLAEVPRLKKIVKTGTGRELTAEELAALRTEYVVYAGEAIPYGDRQELLKELTARQTPFLCLSIAGAQLDRWWEMSGKVWQAQQDAESGTWSATQTTEDWRWTEGETYTVTEWTMSDRLLFDSVHDNDTSQKNTYSFLYRRNGQYRVTFTDVFDDYDLQLIKRAQDSQKPLAGGIFARYLPITGKPDDEVYRQAVEQMYTAYRDAYIGAVRALEALDETRMTLRFTASERLTDTSDYAAFMSLPYTCATVTNPADIGDAFCIRYVVENEDGTETTYCFVDQRVTDTDGMIHYDGVTDDAFAFVEIAAPLYYTTDHRLHVLAREGEPGQTVYLTMNDAPVVELPMTGAGGTLPLWIGGAAFLLLSTAAAGALLYKRRRAGGGSHPTHGSFGS